jgi:uncharacterized MAPEG superfamily protein
MPAQNGALFAGLENELGHDEHARIQTAIFARAKGIARTLHVFAPYMFGELIMRIGFLCLIVATVQPYLWAFLAKVGGMRTGVAYDNSLPRTFLSHLSGWPQRANWAQQNSFEALPVFAAAVLMAYVAQVPVLLADTCALVFIAARFVYFGCYVANWATARSIVWFVGLIACLRLMVAAV